MKMDIKVSNLIKYYLFYHYYRLFVTNCYITYVEIVSKLSCPVKENREDINTLLSLYDLDSLKTRRKTNLLCFMYDQSRENNNVLETQFSINLRGSKKIKLKSQFTRLTIHKQKYGYVMG